MGASCPASAVPVPSRGGRPPGGRGAPDPGRAAREGAAGLGGTVDRLGHDDGPILDLGPRPRREHLLEHEAKRPLP